MYSHQSLSQTTHPHCLERWDCYLAGLKAWIHPTPPLATSCRAIRGPDALTTQEKPGQHTQHTLYVSDRVLNGFCK